MDETDEKLIELLRVDAWQTSGKLARQLNVSSANVRRRRKRLIQSGILKVVAIVDPVRFGLPLIAVVGIKVSADKLDSATEALARQPEVTWLATTAGRFDIMAITRFHSNDELYHFLKSVVAQVEGLKETETFLCFEVKKAFYLMPSEEKNK